MLRKFNWVHDSECKGTAMLIYDEGFQHKAKIIARSLDFLMYNTKVMQTTNAGSIMETLSKSFVLLSFII